MEIHLFSSKISIPHFYHQLVPVQIHHNEKGKLIHVSGHASRGNKSLCDRTLIIA